MDTMKQAGKKKVLFLITKSNWGGAQRYVYDLATHLPDYDVSVAYGTPGALTEKLALANIPTITIPSLGRDIALSSDMQSFSEIFAVLKSAKPDILHLNSSKAAALGAVAGRIAGVPRIIFTVHGWPFKEDRDVISKSAFYVISYLTALLSHEVIVVSTEDLQLGRSMPGVGSKIAHVPISIDTPSFLSRDEASRAHSITTNVFRVVTIAELTTNKGHRFALEAVAALKRRGVDIFYYVIGDGEEMDHLKTEATSLGISDRVVFLGFLAEAATYLKAFDAFLLPSIKEGMPYVLLEARSAGLRIVATSVVDAQFLTSSGQILTILPSDSLAIANALEKCVLTPIAKAQPSATSVTEMVEKTKALY